MPAEMRTGAVTMKSGSIFHIEIDGNTVQSGYSQLSLTGGGSIDLGDSSLATVLGYGPGQGDAFTIISGGPVSGTFKNQPDGSSVALGTFNGTAYSATIHYNPTSVVLTSAVPEPGTLALVGAATAAMAVWRRRRRVDS